MSDHVPEKSQIRQRLQQRRTIHTENQTIRSALCNLIQNNAAKQTIANPNITGELNDIFSLDDPFFNILDPFSNYLYSKTDMSADTDTTLHKSRLLYCRKLSQ